VAGPVGAGVLALASGIPTVMTLAAA
jgi:hypothetical protein